MKSAIRAAINRRNAARSTGPKTAAGKQRSSMNAFQHGLTGQYMMMQEHELEAYRRLGIALNTQVQPAGEEERQLLQKIIDSHTRLNRVAAMDNNILNFSLVENESAAPHDDALESMAAQARAFAAGCHTFDTLSRYESRISRRLLQYTKELDRIQTLRLQSQPAPTTPLNPELASFGKMQTARTMSAAASQSPDPADPPAAPPFSYHRYKA